MLGPGPDAAKEMGLDRFKMHSIPKGTMKKIFGQETKHIGFKEQDSTFRQHKFASSDHNQPAFHYGAPYPEGVTRDRMKVDSIPKETMKKVFTVALIIARTRGLFAEFSEIIGRGQAGMQYTVELDQSDYYVKTAGDVLQCRWLALHGASQEHWFPYNRAQAAFSEWIDLPRLVHGLELGSTVAAWKERALADHNESLTFVLSPKLLHAYVELQAVFHRLCVDRGEGSTMCTWRHWNGDLCTKKRRWGVFCKAHLCLTERTPS